MNDIPLFNVADYQLPQDIMHVLLEGVLPLEMKLLLHQLIVVDNLFTVHHFNARVESFQFGYNTVKPSKIELSHLNDGNLRQSGMQMYISNVLYMYIILVLTT